MRQPEDQNDDWPGLPFRRWALMHDEALRLIFPPDWTHASSLEASKIGDALTTMGVEFNAADEDEREEQVIRIVAALAVLGYCELDDDGLRLRRVIEPTRH